MGARVKPESGSMGFLTTPKSEIWRYAEYKEQARAGAAEKVRGMVEYSDIDDSARRAPSCIQDYDPFVMIPRIKSETVEKKASSAAFDVLDLEEMEDLVDRRALRRADRPHSPTPKGRVPAPPQRRSSYREFCQKRQARLLQLTHDADSISPPAFAATVAEPVPGELLEKVLRRSPARIMGSCSEQLCPEPVGEPADRDESEARASQLFFQGEKRSRFTSIFEELAVKERAHVPISIETKGVKS